ncbi:hypothetical protein A4G99_04245 [Haladaptatus sp. R4]|uniref:winged helix-turn-helix domain-containing protein n=1 Tax=Haladaptatus sp. R4 TaxID=1679489 RepID=UPI0007B4C9C2|nr:winged helix-turn-helix domain-containing protein [Haladaptatus sp. R4]KZN25671.1 hypothetical protein A4G99_04245 [Haladaptatus sp. R4]
MERQLTCDEIFDVLGNRQRRHVLSALLEYDEATTVSELAEMTGSENGGNPERIEIGLVHSHLPRLEGMGIVEYNPETRMVEPTTAVTDLEPFFELIESW